MAQIEPEPPSAVVDVAVKPDDSDSPPRPGSTLWSKPKAVVRIAGAEVSFAAFKSAAGLKKSGLSAEEFLLREPEGGFFIHCRWRLARFMESAPSRIFFLALVVMNGVTIGIQADYPDATVWDPVEYVFISIFCLELAAKMIGFGMTFWTEWWNILDFFIIGASLVEILLKLTVETKTSGISALRLMRVFRVVRLVGFLDKLNMLVQAFFEALKSVAWVMVLVAMVLYIAAVLAHGFFAEYTTPHCPSGNRTDCIHSWFATVMLSFLTLFQIMTLGKCNRHGTRFDSFQIRGVRWLG